ncbi:MAG: hypothetical protein KC933_27325 [Myxococcales bacterium]|nr:hypothetical protein [Myxococcales bacterium]
MLALRRGVAALLTLGAGAPAAWLMADERVGGPGIIRVALATLPVAAGLVFVRRLEPQILARAVLWGLLVVGTLLAVAVNGSAVEAHLVSLAFALGAGAALLALGASGLDAPPARAAFVPQAFRGVLVSILVMAIADTCTLIFWSGLALENKLSPTPGPQIFVVTSAVVMLVAVMGLYGLRVWGFALNMLANVGIAAGAWLVGLDAAIATSLTATAAAQLLVGLPLLRGLAAGRETEALPPRVARALAATVIAGLMLTAVVARVHHAGALG